MSLDKNKESPASFGGSSYENAVIKFKGDLAFTSETFRENLLLLGIAFVGCAGFLFLIYTGSYFGGLFIGTILMGTAYAMNRFRPYIEIDRAIREVRIYKAKKDKQPSDVHTFGQKVTLETLEKFVSGQGTAPGFKSIELNINLDSGKRVTLLNHAKADKIKTAQATLRTFLM